MGGSGKGSGKGSAKGGVRQGGGFAKRNAASSKLSRKIGWLNNHGGLLEEIRFTEVKEILTQLGDDEAMVILLQLQKKAREVKHPTAYVLSAARRSLSGGRRRGKGGKGGGKQRGKEHESAPEPADEEVMDLEANEEPLDEDDEGHGVSTVDLREAEPRDEERDFEEDLDGHMDDEEEEDSMPNSDDAGKVEDTLRYLNSQGGLSKDLEVDSLVTPLAELGMEKAMDILSHLEQKGGEVRDPTAYVLAATNAASRKGSGRGARNARRPGSAKQVKKLHLKENSSSSSSFDPILVDKVKKRISWLNDKGRLKDKLAYEKVGENLLKAGPIGEIMKVFKTLEENAAEVRNPNGWILAAAQRLATEGVAPEPRSSAQRAAQREETDFRDEPLHEQLRAHISWLNREVPLNAPLDFAQVAKFLLELDTSEAGSILRRLEDNAKEVRDPTTYVIRAAQRTLDGPGSGKGGGGGGKRQPPPPPRALQVPEPPPSRSGGAASMDKIAKRVAWLNQNAQLAAPLDYEKVAPTLNSIGYYQSLDVLNTLEEHASTVRNPNAYVLSTARNIGREGGQLPPTLAPMPAVPAPPPAPGPKGHGKGGAHEDKIYRRIEWLNKNVCPTKQIDASRAGSELLKLESIKAMEVLKNFEENADEARDSTGYVIGTARRALKGEVIGTAPREPREPQRQEDRKAKVPPVPPRPRQAKGGGRLEAIGSFSSRPVREPPAAPSRGSEGRLRTRINWLNDKAGLQGPLDAERITPQLLRVKNDKDAMDILKRVEESASTIRDPTAYVISAVRRALDGKGGRGH